MAASIAGKISSPARNHRQTGLDSVGIGAVRLFYRMEFSILIAAEWRLPGLEAVPARKLI